MSRREWQYLVILFVSIVIVFSLIISVLPTPSPAVSVPTLMVLPPEPASVADLPANTPPSLSEDVSVAAEPPVEAAPEVMAAAPVEPLPVAFAPTDVPTSTPPATATEAASNTPTVPPPPTVPQPTNTQQFGSFQWVATPVSVPVYVPPVDPVPGQVVVQFAPQASVEERAAYIESIGGTVTEEIAALDAVVVTVTDTTAAAQLPPSPVVAEAEPDYYISAQFSIPPNDPLYGDQWALQAINAPQAWAAMPADAPRVPVAVIDSGICAGHPDLAGRILPGYDFVQDDADPQDEFGHGCAVSGIIAANADDGIGIAGAAPNAMIMPLRVLDGSGMGLYSDVAAAITYAADNGAQVINLSLGGAARSSVLEAAIDYAIARGVTVVAAAGNTGGAILFPAAYEPVISVGAVDQNLQLASFSAHGADVLAPGVAIQTTDRAGAWTAKNGTSFAAPYQTSSIAMGSDSMFLMTSNEQIAPIDDSATPSSSLTDDPLLGVESAVADAISQDPFFVDGNVYWQAEGFQVYEDWASAFLIPYEIGTGSVVPTTPLVGLAQRTNGRWIVTLPTQPATFNAALEIVPNELIPAENKVFLHIPDVAAQYANAVTGYYLPWPEGEYGYAARHNGSSQPGYMAIDFAIPSQVYAARDGTVVFRKEASNTSCGDGSCSWTYANMVVIQSGSEYHWYMHLAVDSIPDDIQEGQPVYRGQLIGLEGATGWATGNHLHFMVQVSGWQCCFGSGATRYPAWPGYNSPPLAPVNFAEYSWTDFPISYDTARFRSQNTTYSGGGGSLNPPTMTYPGDGATVNSRTINFTWQSPNSPNQNGYTLRVSTSSNPDTSPWIHDNGYGNNVLSQSVTVPSDGTFYWHMRTWNTSNQSSSWRTYRFVVNTSQTGNCTSAPGLSSPSSGATLTSATNSFSWGALSCTHNSIQFRINDSTNLDDSPIVDTELSAGLTSHSATVPSQYFNQNLYWGIRVNTSSGGYWSEARPFRVEPVGACSGPSLTSPSNGAVLTSSTVTFSWSALSGCTFSGYTFRVNDSSNMDDTPIVDTGVGGTSRTETIASTWHNRDLWWGVRAANSPAGASWSVRQFRVEPAAACSGPSLTSPSNGAVLTSSTATFSWNVLSGCTFSGYTFRVNDSSNMDDTPIVDTGVGGTSRTETISSTWHNRDLWWGVRAANAPAGASWSVRQFRVEPVVACSGPSLTSPSNGAVLTSSTVTFSWSALSGCTFSGYTFRVNDSSNMDDSPIIDTGEGGTSRTETISSTWHNRDLWWGVRAANASGGASWSVRQFRVQPDTTAPQVQFTNPSAARWYNFNSIQLSVEASDLGSGMSHVVFYVGYDPAATGAALAQSVSVPNTPDPAVTDERGDIAAQAWDWTVLGTDSNGADGWSMTWDASSVPDQNGVAFFVYVYDNAGNNNSAVIWGNGLDRSAPVTTMNTLPQYSPATFTVSWTGVDNLSGVDVYDLEVSTNGGAWTSVVTGWMQNSYVFSGQLGMQYAFRVRASDIAGNVEAFYQTPGAETAVPTAVAPANDTYANASIITALPTFIEQSVAAAGTAGDPPLCDAAGWQNQHVVWFRYTPTANVTLNVATTGTQFDTVIALFNGTPSSGTRNGLCDDDSGRNNTSVLYRNLQVNQTYYIGVGLFGSTPLAQDIPLKVQFLSRPSNDWWIGSSPVNLGSLPTTYSMNVIGATPDDELNLCDPVPSYQNSVWFTFTPSAADTVTVSTDGSNYDTVLAVYAGNPESGTKLGCNDDVQPGTNLTSALQVTVVAGTTYYVGVAAWGSSPLTTDGHLNLSVTGTSPPPTNLIVNGDFTGGYTGWLGYHWNPIAINGGVMEFSLPQGQPYGVLWQQINRGLASGTPLELSFDLQNTSSAPRTLQVYLRDQDWGTARQCNFTLPANMPMRRFTMQALTGSNWGSILAQWWWMNGDGGPVVRIDNIDLRQPSPVNFTGTTCSGLQASANENLIANGDFSQGYANWLGYHWNPVGITNGAFTFGLPNGQPWGVLWQEGSTGVPNGAPLELSFQLANTASVSRTFAVYLRATDWNTLQRCDFNVPANLPLTTYRMRIRTGAAFDRVFTQFWLLNGDGQPPMQIDDIVLRYRPELSVTLLECNGATASPTVGNLIQNPSFNGGFANWWGIGLNPVYVENAMMSFDIPAGQAYGTLWQEVSGSVTAGTPLELSFNLGNTGSIAQTVRVFLRDLDWGTARTCSFTLPANAAMRTYSMRAAPGTNWGRILAQWWLDNGDGSPAITIDDVSLYTRPGTSTALECSAPLALEVDPLSVSPTGDGTTAPSGPALIPTATASPTTYTIPTATPTSGLIPTASLTPSVPTLIPTATATVPPPTEVPSATATAFPPSETPLPPTDVPIPTATDVPSATPLPPTDIPTEVPPPTVVPTDVPTDVPPPPTAVPTDVPPPPPTDIPTDVPPPVEPPPADPGAVPPVEGGA